MFIAITFNDNPVQPQRGDMFTSSIPPANRPRPTGLKGRWGASRATNMTLPNCAELVFRQQLIGHDQGRRDQPRRNLSPAIQRALEMQHVFYRFAPAAALVFSIER